jgi:serine/threonine-protein kinase
LLDGRADGDLPRRLGASLVSRYAILEEIGRGGMGRVLRAYDPKLQREVAIKEVRHREMSEESARRLVAEARAMAKLSHPNVVSVFDVEQLDSGEVVLIMEFVAGQTLKRWLADGDHEWTAILECFAAAGRGLAAAHEAGLLHRDFKPANVLVTPGVGSDRVAVKVTDFGLAKTTASTSGSDSSVGRDEFGSGDLTQPGTVMGTPRFMAPEQHIGDSLTAAADQYAYCVALWMALCSEPPFSSPTMVADKRHGPPAWPRSDVPRRIADAIRRGLSPEPQDRWPSMTALLDAIAWDPARRRQRRVVGAASVTALASVGVVGGIWLQARAQRCTGAEGQLAGIWDDARRSAVRAALENAGPSYAMHVSTRTQQELDDYAQAWTAMYTEACKATTIRGEQSDDVLTMRMSCLQRAAVELEATTRQLSEADPALVRKAHRLTTGLRPLSRCADLVALAQDVEPPLPEEADRVERVHADLADARVALRGGRYERAKAALETATRGATDLEHGPLHSEVALVRGDVLAAQGEYAAAETAILDAVELASQWHDWDRMQRGMARLMFVVGYRQGRTDEGLRYARLARGLSRGDPLLEANVVSSTAALLNAQGKYAEAEAEHRRVLTMRENMADRDFQAIAASLNNLSSVLFAEGKYEEAETNLRRALELWEHELGPEHPDAATVRGNLGMVLQVLGRHDEAEAEQRTALAALERGLGPDHAEVAASRSNLGDVLFVQGKFEAAAKQHRLALAAWEKAVGPDHPNVAGTRSSLARSLAAIGNYEEAQTQSRKGLMLLEKALGPEHPDTATARAMLADILAAQHQYAEAETVLRLALSQLEQALDPQHPHIAAAQTQLGELLLRRGEATQARTLLERAWTRRQRDDVAPAEAAKTAFLLARALSRSGEHAKRARSLAERAAEAYETAGPEQTQQLREVRSWLAAQEPG